MRRRRSRRARARAVAQVSLGTLVFFVCVAPTVFDWEPVGWVALGWALATLALWWLVRHIG
jgi:hypothetical protein